MKPANAKRSSPFSIDAHIGRKLKIRRVQMDLTQRELAELIDVSYQQIQKYETGKNRISCYSLHLFCQRLNVSFDYFFEGITTTIAEPSFPITNGQIDRKVISILASFSKIEDPDTRHKIIELLKSISRNKS